MDRLSEFRNRMRMVAAVCTACCAAALTACSDDTDTNDGRLPDGQYPITLTATVEGQTATRATSDNTWAGTEEVALQVGGEVKKYTVAAGGALTVTTPADPHYWTAKTMTVQVWHSPQGYSATRPAEFTVQADQSGTNGSEGFQQSDLLYTSQSITYDASTNASNPPQLTFKHLPAKVVVNLKADTQSGVTADEVTNATVTLVNQALTSGAITYDDAALAAAPVSVAQATAGNVLTPKVNATATPDYQQTVQALLVPQQMQGKQFVKITVGSDVAARTYYYVPKNDDANLEHGKQYTYNITVKKEKLEVTASSSVSWTDDETSGDAAKATSFHVTMPVDHGQSLTPSTNATLNSGNYDVTGSSFTLSYTVTDDNKIKGFPAVKGLCDLTRASTTNGGTTTYTFTYSNVRSDLWLSYGLYAEVGDFYMNDGTWVPYDASLSDEQKAACIGIVMKVGRDETGDWKDDCQYKLKDGTTPMNDIHGYVLSLNEGNSENTCAWGSYGTSVVYQADGADMMNRKQQIGFYGYKNTQAIILFNKSQSGDLSTAFPAAYYATAGYEAVKKQQAPDNSSGWFLPSSGQCWYWYQNRDKLSPSFKKALGSDSFNWFNRYWSSSECSDSPKDYAWYVNFFDGYVYLDTKGIDYNNRVRSCLAF